MHAGCNSAKDTDDEVRVWMLLALHDCCQPNVEHSRNCVQILGKKLAAALTVAGFPEGLPYFFVCPSVLALKTASLLDPAFATLPADRAAARAGEYVQKVCSERSHSWGFRHPRLTCSICSSVRICRCCGASCSRASLSR